MARREKVRLGELLVKQKLISQDQLKLAVEQHKSSGLRLGRVLVNNGFVTEENFCEALAAQLGIPYIDLKDFVIDLDLVRLLPERHARRLLAIVLEERDDRLLIGMADPTDLSATDLVSLVVKRVVEVAVVTEGQLLECIDHSY